MKLPKVYEPQAYENDIYALWEKAGAFVPKNRGSKDAYSIVVPPPNANGDLHLGHGLTLAVEDIAVRYHRMKGEAALLLPGADHAGFETQVVYEKELAKQGKSRFDFSREELYAQIWDFVAKNRHIFEKQIRQLGASVDWSRFVFTLDDKIVLRAFATFKQMWDDKLIYRGERLVNFCTFHGTAFADIEVTYKEVEGRLWFIRYPLSEGSGEVVVATTRPETMLGDVAVAVHPDDKRYKQFVGKTVKLPLTNREIPIIGDEMVDREFGTGAVKITPAHDPNDFEVAERHDLPKITVIGFDGKMTAEAPKAYQGLTVEEARDRVVKDLEAKKLLVMTKNHTHSVGHCYKCGTVIQPLLREQWFVNMQPLAQEAIKVLRADKIVFYPAGKRDQLIRYLEGLKDWNISRQIAWGIPIPAFQNTKDPNDWIFDERVGEETIEANGHTYQRDPDVFDTWFSSGSWPYVTLDYPDGKDFEQFYPLSLMETGADILYPWVSRMIMMGLYVTKEIPFKSVYLHGLIQDEQGQKMSKSKGNVIDPMTKVAEFGSDAFRMGLIANESAGNNRPYDASKVVGARNFANKLWNVARFIEDQLGDHYRAEDPSAKTPADHWLLTKLQQLTEKITADLENYRFSEAYESLYHLVWDDFADWYVESAKTTLNRSVLAFGLETILRLAHPFAPFVTETIWQTVPWTGGDLLITSKWPEVPAGNSAQAKIFEEIQVIVSEVRYLTTTLRVRELTLYYTDVPFLGDNAALIQRLAGLEGVKEVTAGSGLHLTQTRYKCWVDIDLETTRRYLEELGSKKQAQEKVVKGLKSRLDNKAYLKKAPAEVVEQTHAQLDEAEALLANMNQEYQRFSQAKED